MPQTHFPTHIFWPTLLLGHPVNILAQAGKGRRIAGGLEFFAGSGSPAQEGGCHAQQRDVEYAFHGESAALS